MDIWINRQQDGQLDRVVDRRLKCWIRVRVRLEKCSSLFTQDYDGAEINLKKKIDFVEICEKETIEDL